MRVTRTAFTITIAIFATFFFITSATSAKDRWDGASVCVDHKSRVITAASDGTCQGGKTLIKMGVEARNGIDGTQILSGTGNPNVGVGADGDFYIDLTTGNLFGPKVESSWSAPLVLKGRDGADASGSQGPTGPTGPAGPAGPSGLSVGYHIQGDYVEIIADSESPSSYVSWSQVINTSRSGLVLDAGHYLVQFSGVASGAGYLPPSRGTCSLYSAQSDSDSGGYQNYEVPAGAQEYAPTIFAGSGYIELDEYEYIVLDCAASYYYGPLNNMGHSYSWNGSTREEYIVELSLIRLDNVEFVSDWY